MSELVQSETKEHYRVGIIGCGGISTAHANAYKAIESTEIVAAEEPAPERRAKFDETYNVVSLYE
ncbi:hypothetical protein HYR99_34690, partial [Candidatus Poribacteria bacterium]|nr:hypothetical protein [Candidatus Poribacteria bacterium]